MKLQWGLKSLTGLLALIFFEINHAAKFSSQMNYEQELLHPMSQSNAISHWLGANLESALDMHEIHNMTESFASKPCK